MLNPGRLYILHPVKIPELSTDYPLMCVAKGREGIEKAIYEDADLDSYPSVKIHIDDVSLLAIVTNEDEENTGILIYRLSPVELYT